MSKLGKKLIKAAKEGRRIVHGETAVEITKEMIDAGVEALWATGAVEHPCGLDKEVVKSVYEAMEAVKPDPFKISRETTIKISKEVSEKFMENNKVFQR